MRNWRSALGRTAGTTFHAPIHAPVLALAELRPGAATESQPVTLAGPTCDSVDVMARGYPMPPLSVGDVVVSPMMGAYTAVTSTRFNGIAETPIVVAPGAGLCPS